MRSHAGRTLIIFRLLMALSVLKTPAAFGAFAEEWVCHEAATQVPHDLRGFLHQFEEKESFLLKKISAEMVQSEAYLKGLGEYPERDFFSKIEELRKSYIPLLPRRPYA